MNEQHARRIIELMLRQGRELDALLVELESDGLTGEPFSQLRKSVGRVMGSMLLDVMNPIFDRFPALKPKGLT